MRPRIYAGGSSSVATPRMGHPDVEDRWAAFRGCSPRRGVTTPLPPARTGSTKRHGSLRKRSSMWRGRTGNTMRPPARSGWPALLLRVEIAEHRVADRPDPRQVARHQPMFPSKSQQALGDLLSGAEYQEVRRRVPVIQPYSLR
jgi:hypothetical protein